MGAALAGVSITPLFPIVSAASRPTISPAPLVFPMPPLARTVAALHVLKPKPQNPLAGLASWYGAVLHGHRSADGGTFDETLMTAAHRSLPFGTMVRVIDITTGRSVIVRITDRGALAPGRIIDLSSSAATNLGILGQGVAACEAGSAEEGRVAGGGGGWACAVELEVVWWCRLQVLFWDQRGFQV